ncbi:hypothetical protein SAMN05216318_1022 [Nitrosomonas eutropha]|nr:hypothetical protein SAMN05216318_1022 [Nitrosomonas eutropha]
MAKIPGFLANAIIIAAQNTSAARYREDREADIVRARYTPVTAFYFSMEFLRDSYTTGSVVCYCCVFFLIAMALFPFHIGNRRKAQAIATRLSWFCWNLSKHGATARHCFNRAKIFFTRCRYRYSPRSGSALPVLELPLPWNDCLGTLLFDLIANGLTVIVLCLR